MKWAAELEQRLGREKESWMKTIMEPMKKKWKLEFEERLRQEKVLEHFSDK